MAQEYQCRPSSLVGIEDDPWLSWCLDEATYLWGRHLDSQVKEASQKGKTDKARQANAQRELTKWLSDPSRTEQVVQGRFRDPAMLLKGGSSG
jgi:hypothetical protein